ncbi:MAG: proline iminopeptidase-family hydrolase [Bryobacterales bacterium]|nr:proline iminopeptidase-family hydrolase [Bryobacterales bacterium]
MAEIKTGGVRMIPVRGGEYRVWTKRVGRGPAVMLTLHGGPGCTHEYFECFEDFLPRQGIEFYYYDQLGSHYSDQPEDIGLWTVERFRDEVEEVRAGLGLGNFILYGQSWGGMLAIEYALAHPEHLKALIISNMTASIPSYAAYINELRRRLPPEIQEVMEIYEARGEYSAPEYEKILIGRIYSQYLCRTNPWPEPLARMFRHMNFQVYNTMQGPNEFIITGNFKDWDRWADLHRIQVPTLLLVGEHDTMNPADIAEMGRRIPNSRVAVIPGGSHCTMWDAQEPYFEALLRFVADVQSGRFAGALR